MLRRPGCATDTNYFTVLLRLKKRFRKDLSVRKTVIHNGEASLHEYLQACLDGADKEKFKPGWFAVRRRLP